MKDDDVRVPRRTYQGSHSTFAFFLIKECVLGSGPFFATHYIVLLLKSGSILHAVAMTEAHV